MLEEKLVEGWKKARLEAQLKLVNHNFDFVLNELFESYISQPRYRALHAKSIEIQLEHMQSLGYSDNCVEYFAVLYRIIRDENR